MTESGCRMKTAVLYNSNAGKGLPPDLVLSRLASFFSGDELLVTMEELDVVGLPTRLVEVPENDGSYLGVLTARVKALADAGAERFVSVGGDGTATYVVTILNRLGLDLPILGVAAGTANVGPVVSLTLEQLQGRSISRTCEKRFDGIQGILGGKVVRLAFNDVIVGDTFLATVDGKTCNVSAPALLRGEGIVPQKPREDLILDTFCVERNGKEIHPAPGKIRQVVITSLAGESHYGRAVYGPLCNCDWTERKGVIALCDHIAVSMDADAGIHDFSTMQYLLFGSADHVTLRGFAPGACVICDGNPYFLSGDEMELRYIPELVRTITIQ